MDIIMHGIPSADIDLVLLIAGYALGIGTKFKQPLMLTIFLLRVLDWWIKNHPIGKKMAAETTLDEEFAKLFGPLLEKHDAQEPTVAKADQ